MSYQETLLGLLPPVSYTRHADGIRAQAHIDGAALDDVAEHAGAIAKGIYPATAGDLLLRWERVLGLEGKQPYQQRLSAVLMKINAIGGLSIPYFTQLAAAAGYQITIIEPQPFRASVNRVGDRLAREDIMFVWHVNILSSSTNIWHFRAGSNAAGNRLSEYGDGVIEAMFQDLKPAHTDVYFNYQG